MKIQTPQHSRTNATTGIHAFDEISAGLRGPQGNAANSLIAIHNIKVICAEHFRDAHELEIVDLLENPGRALTERVLAMPTLAMVLPQPRQLMTGNPSDTARVLQTLASR